MTDQQRGPFERFVQRLAQVFIKAVDTIEGNPVETPSKVESDYLNNQQARDTVAHSKAHPEEVLPRPTRKSAEGE